MVRRAWEKVGLFAVGGGREYGINGEVAEEDERMHGMRPAMDRTGCWRVGIQ